MNYLRCHLFTVFASYFEFAAVSSPADLAQNIRNGSWAFLIGYDFENWSWFWKLGMILKIGYDFENWVWFW
jgi:hypothetical protein